MTFLVELVRPCVLLVAPLLLPSVVQANEQSALLVSSDSFVRRAVYDYKKPSIRIVSREKDPATQEWADSSYTYSTSFKVTHIASRTSHEFYVLGKTRTGLDILELWHLDVQPGVYVASRAASSEPLGVPVTTPPFDITIAGPQFVHPSNRSKPLSYRTEIYLGSIGIDSLMCDPDGRFLLLVGGHALRRLTVQQDGSPSITTLYTHQQVPELSYDSGLHCMKHVSAGRVSILSGGVNPFSTWQVMFFDVDNDGLIESFHQYTYQAYLDSALYGGWLDNYFEG